MANYLETNGQRDDTLSGTVWTLTLGASEKWNLFLARRDGNVFLSWDRGVSAVATFCCHNLFSLGTPCSVHLTASLRPCLAYSSLTYERSAAARHKRADKRLKVTEKEKDNVNQFSKLGIDWTCPIDVTEFKANGKPVDEWNMLTLRVPMLSLSPSGKMAR